MPNPTATPTPGPGEISGVGGRTKTRYRRRLTKDEKGREFIDNEGNVLSDADFRAKEDDFREDAGNTVGGGKDLSGTMRSSSVPGTGAVRVRPVDAPVIREEGESLGEKAERERKKTKTPSALQQSQALRSTKTRARGSSY